ncbi:MAG TPA: twin-arginine translocation signal domain-containing protein, partial [Chryseolinea sp.]|nr:twin-arginine translocation signal domain-containing protein [Chryseolinea sp.]
MKNTIQQIVHKNKQREKTEAEARQAEIESPSTKDNRRDFLKKTALGGITLTGLMGLSVEDTIAQTTSKVKKASAPSDLKITDLRYCVTTVLGRTAIIRIDTNQGIYGLGEVRDG